MWRAPQVPTRLRRSDHPLAPALIGLLAASVMVALYAGGDLSRLVRAAPPWADPAATPAGLAVVENGYDGMFYYRLALDPLTDSRTERGITLDLPAYRQQRILYPLFGWAAALGDERRVPAALALVNVLAVFGLGWVGGALARSAGRHALWGTLFVAYPGIAVTLRSDLTEAVGAVFVLGGLLLMRSAHTARGSVALTLAALARETTLLVPAAVALTRVLRAPRSVGGWLPLALPGVVAIAWQAVVILRWRSIPAAEGVTALDPPFLGLFAAAWLNVERLPADRLVIWAAMLAFVLAMVVVGARALATASEIAHERAAWYGYAALATVLEANIWANEAMLRSLTELGMLTALLALAASASLRWTLLGVEVALMLLVVTTAGGL